MKECFNKTNVYKVNGSIQLKKMELDYGEVAAIIPLMQMFMRI